MISLFQLALVLLTVIMLAIGQILFKFAATYIDIENKGLLNNFIFNPALLIGLIVYMIATITWLFVLKELPLKVAYPFAALGYFIVPFLSHFFLNEPMALNSFVGAGIIMIGVYVSTY
jgi:undecaprenyl phosphate-alpha-L-ara4N flippase subunit ArnE